MNNTNNNTTNTPFTQREIGALKILAETLITNPDNPSATTAYSKMTRPDSILRLLNQHEELLASLTSTNELLEKQYKFSTDLTAAANDLVTENENLRKSL